MAAAGGGLLYIGVCIFICMYAYNIVMFSLLYVCVYIYIHTKNESAGALCVDKHPQLLRQLVLWGLCTHTDFGDRSHYTQPGGFLVTGLKKLQERFIFNFSVTHERYLLADKPVY